MVFRLTRLKMLLMVDLLILIIVIPGYFYADSQIPKPAEFELTDLALDSDWVQIGEPVQISVKVINIGKSSGNLSVTLTIDDLPIKTTIVQLSGGENTTVTFSATETIEGDHKVTIGSLTRSLRVTADVPTKEAELQLSNLVTNRKEAEVGEPITVSISATNIGDANGEFSLELFVNNQERATRTIQLDGGQTSHVQFEIVENVEAEYVVKIGTLSTSFIITSEAQPVKPAEFQVTDLTVNPSSVLSDEVVAVSVMVTNIGEATGDYTVTLRIDGVTRGTRAVSLAGQATEVVEFEITESNSGTHNVEVGNMFESFIVESLASASPDTKLSRMIVNPYEVWNGETVNIRAKADNLVNEPGSLRVRLLIGGVVEATKTFSLEAGATDVPIEFLVTAGSGPTDIGTKGYRVELLNMGNQSNSLIGFFQVASDGFHTLAINRAGGGTTPMIFTLNGVTYETPYYEFLPVGEYSIATDEIVDLGTGIVEFSHWGDGLESASRTFTFDKYESMLAHYNIISGYASCPSLYTWNGTDYSYITEVSNAGWLGYMDYINESGDFVFSGGNPWDHVKIVKSQLQTRTDTDNNYDYYDIVLFQQWDEIYYLDTAYMVVVDHPKDVDAYSTMVNYVNRGFYGDIYTVNPDELLMPISATNENGDDVLFEISQLDGIFTPGIDGVLSPSWDNVSLNQLVLNLGDLSAAPDIKLLIHGMVDWGPAEPYYNWIDQFKIAFSEGVVPNGTIITSPPTMEVMDAEGNWVRIPQDREIPVPADYIPRTFCVDLMGLFPTDVSEYKIRITNFWNVTFDYIGIDTSPQKEIAVYEIPPIATLEPLDFATTESTVSGNFTKYGDVSPLLGDADDIFVIGMQGDKISLKYPIENIPSLQDDKERSVFFFVACWFKDPPWNWGYGFDFTVEPLPFRNMTGFPYTDAESYPYDAEHKAFIKQYNTRTRLSPNQPEPQSASLTTWVSVVFGIMTAVDLGIIFYYRKRNSF
ncbi:CARDB domain-containing protein [Thermoproteota archaeon]